MQILGIKNGRSVNSLTKIASSGLEERLWHLRSIHEDNNISYYQSVLAASKTKLGLQKADKKCPLAKEELLNQELSHQGELDPMPFH